MKLIVSRAALADLQRLHDFLIERNLFAARRAVDVLDRAMHSLDIFPGRGRPTATPNVRELIVPFGRAGYVLRYGHSEGSNEIIILRIWHEREQRE